MVRDKFRRLSNRVVVVAAKSRDAAEPMHCFSLKFHQ